MEKLSSEVKNFTRNPLGVIGLFIFLVHAVGAGVLGASIDKLTPYNQSVLVWFVILFPVGVLLFFGWMLSRHHDKLYGPGDFQSDKSYLEYANRANVGWRAAADLTQAASPNPDDAATGSEQPTHQQATPQDESNATGGADAETASAQPPAGESETDHQHAQQGGQAPARAGRRGLAAPNVSAFLSSTGGSRVQAAYLAESLVFNELERETGAAVRRNIRIQSRGRSIEVDGLLERNGQRTAVEVQFITSNRLSMNRLREKIARLTELMANPDNGISNVLFAFVVDGNTLNDLRNARQAAQSVMPSNFSLRFYSFESLLSEYSLAENPLEGV